MVLITREHRRIHTPHPSHCESCQKTAKFKRALFAEITRINSQDPGRHLHSTSDFVKQYHDSRCRDAYVKIEDRLANKHSWDHKNHRDRVPVVWSHDASLRQICQRWVMICLPCTLGPERPNAFRIANTRCTENALRICRTSKTLPNKCTGPVLPSNVHTVPHPMMHLVTASRRWTRRARVLHCLRMRPQSSSG